MASDNETVADICAEKRRTADNIEASAKGEPNQFQRELIASLRGDADRIEAAHMREVAEAATKAATDAVNLTNEKWSRETVDIESRVEHSSGGFFYNFHDVLKRLASVCWRETMFADMQTYYAEEGVYVLRCKHGTPNAHYCIIRAKSLDEAISRAVFDLHKANESREVGVAENATTTGDGAKMREALNKIAHYDDNEYSMDDYNCADGHVCADIARAALSASPLTETAENVNSGSAIDAGVNMAKMRKALEHVEKLAREFAAGNYYLSDFPKMLLDTIRPALAAPPEPQGDGAKMREAMESISSILKGFDFDNQNAPTPDDLNCVHSAIGIADAALAAPPRNCDIYKTEDEATEAWMALDDECDDALDPFGWLFAKAKKGGAK